MASSAKYHWTPTESAPVEFVVQIIDGHFETDDGYKKGIPTRALVNRGWAKGRSWVVEGPDTLGLPKKMEITWFSYREDTFYRGNFDLPYERLAALFKEKQELLYGGTEVQYGTFVVGLAPGGFVVVWVSSAKHSHVIFKGFAEPVDDVPWSKVFNGENYSKAEIMKETIDESRQEAQESGARHWDDPNYWQRLHNELYKYDIVVESPYTPYSMSANFLDETGHDYRFDEWNRWKEEPRSVPSSITFEYIFPNRIPVVPIDNFDSDELYAAFRHLSKDYDGVLRFVITVEGDLHGWGYRPKIRIENDKESIEIKKFDFRPIDSSDLLKYLEGNKDMQRYVNQIGKPANP